MRHSGVLEECYEQKKERIVGMYSKVLSETQTRYGSTEREALRVIEGIRRFKALLLRGHFELVMDNIGLGYILAGEAKSKMVHLWALELLTLDYTVVHRAGRLMGLADALSRLGREDIFGRNAINWDDEDAIHRRLPKTLTAVPSKRHG